MSSLSRKRREKVKPEMNVTPLVDVVSGLNRHPRLFVSVFGRVGGILTRSDLQKAPVRMWLFGMVTILEVGFVQLIESMLGDGPKAK